MKRGRKIDDTRHLCKSCKKLYDDCSNENYETGESDNVFKCDGYKKSNINKGRWRGEVGEAYYVMIIEDEKNSPEKLIPKRRIENKNRVDSTYHEFGNYYKTPIDCQKRIIELQNIKK